MTGVQEVASYITGHQMSSGTGANAKKGLSLEKKSTGKITEYWKLGVLIPLSHPTVKWSFKLFFAWNLLESALKNQLVKKQQQHWTKVIQMHPEALF